MHTLREKYKHEEADGKICPSAFRGGQINTLGWHRFDTLRAPPQTSKIVPHVKSQNGLSVKTKHYTESRPGDLVSKLASKILCHFSDNSKKKCRLKKPTINSQHEIQHLLLAL